VRCPCCGSETDRLPPESLAAAADIKGQKRIILDALVKAGVGTPVLYQALENAVYSGQSSGGPMWARRVLHVAKYQLRSRLRPLGYDIGSYSGGRGGEHESAVWLTWVRG
jgi:hypothetical protein